MPDVTAIEVSYNRKVQLEQFEPVQHSVTLHAEIGEGEYPSEVYEDLSDSAEEMVEQALARRITQKKLEEDSEDE